MRAAALALRARPGLTLARPRALPPRGLLAGCALLAASWRLRIGASHAHPRDAIDDSPAAVALAPRPQRRRRRGSRSRLAALGWDRSAGLALAGDLVVAASLIANGAVVGWALARTGLELAAYLPHLPFEWAALAIPAGAWLCLRRGAPPIAAALLLRALGLTAVALLVAALLEVYAAPLG